MRGLENRVESVFVCGSVRYKFSDRLCWPLLMWAPLRLVKDWPTTGSRYADLEFW